MLKSSILDSYEGSDHCPVMVTVETGNKQSEAEKEEEG